MVILSIHNMPTLLTLHDHLLIKSEDIVISHYRNDWWTRDHTLYYMFTDFLLILGPNISTSLSLSLAF